MATDKTKFQTHALLANNKSYTPIPRFFFRLWLIYGENIPSSFWNTLFFVLDATLGRSLAGIEGDLAQSQIPVERHESAKWIAAMVGYGLLEVKYSTYTNPVASEFKLNPTRTELDWIGFVLLVGCACREGKFARGKTVVNVRKDWERFSTTPQKPPLWSLILAMGTQDKATDEDVDVWDDENWVARGFNARAMYDETVPMEQYDDGEWFRPTVMVKELAVLRESLGAYAIVVQLFHILWTKNSPDEESVVFPESEFPKFVELCESMWGKIEPETCTSVLSLFKNVQVESIACLESEWLTRQWQAAKAEAEWEPKPKDVRTAEAVDAMQQAEHAKILSRRKREG